MNLKFKLVTTALLSLAAGLNASVVTETREYGVSPLSGAVPDNRAPLTLTQTIGDSAILSLTEVQLSLRLVGSTGDLGWAGDLFVSLNYDFTPATAILLNRVGVTDGDSLGFSYGGWDVTFRDDAVSGDIHLAQPLPGTPLLTGLWQPDGRENPLEIDRSARLDALLGNPGNGQWNLTFADLSPGGTMTVESWTLTLVGEGVESVPESSNWGAGALLLVAASMLARRRTGRTD